MPPPRRDWIFVTGQPGCGKTTAVQRLCRALQEAGLPVQGFITQEVRGTSNGGATRSGFDIVTVPDGRRVRLARKQGFPSTWPSTGAYRVDVASLDQVAVPTLALPSSGSSSRSTGCDESPTRADLSKGNTQQHNDPVIYQYYVLDEIGRMELHSEAFRTAVRNLLNGACDDEYDGNAPRIRLVGAVTAPRYGHRVAFCDWVTTQDGVQVHHLTKKTREQVTLDLLDYIQTHWIDDGGKRI